MENSELRMAVVFRADLNLPNGKACAQAGHAFLTAWTKCENRELATAYMANSQAKIILVAPNLDTLHKIIERAKKRGVSYALITDEGRTVFDGVPTVTCLGIGPCDKTSYNNITRALSLME